MKRDLDDVSVVELVLQGDDLPHKAQGTELMITRSLFIAEHLFSPSRSSAGQNISYLYLQEGVARLDQDQDSPQQILIFIRDDFTNIGRYHATVHYAGEKLFHLGEDVIFDVVGVMLNKEAQQL